MRGRKIDEVQVILLLGILLVVIFGVAACGNSEPSEVPVMPVMERVARSNSPWGNSVELYFFEHDGDRCYVASRGEQTANLACDFGER